MVVFNLPAIPVILAIAVVVAPLFWLFPSVMERPHGNLIIGLVGMLVGGVSEAFGLKGRLFFMPVWLVGLLVSGWGAWSIWGWWGAGAGASAVVAALGGLVLYAAHADKRDWARAPRALVSARAHAKADEDDDMWTELDRAFFIPSIRALTPPMCVHNMEVLELLIEQTESRVSRTNIRLLRSLQAQFADAQLAEEPEVKQDLVDFARDFILNKGSMDIPADADPQRPAYAA